MGLNLDRWIFCTINLSHTRIDRYISDISKISTIYLRYIENIDDISPIFSIYRRYIKEKMPKNFPHVLVSFSADKLIEYRLVTDISAIFHRYFSTFFDFTTERFSMAKIVSMRTDIRYIADISQIYQPICKKFQTLAVVGSNPST